MKTTFNIDDGVMRRVKAEAARRGCTMTELVETALRRLLEEREPSPDELPELPVFDGGPVRVDVADREALYHVMEES